MERKRKDLSLKEKLDILDRFDKLETKMSQRNAAAQLGISQPLLCKILKSREDLVRKSKESGCLDSKRNRKGKDASVEKALKVWCTHVQKRGYSVDGPLMQLKAEELALEMGKKDFVATSGWLQRWKKRENIVYKCGETKNADVPVADRWITEEWPKLRKEYAPENVYSARETGLHFQALPEHTHVFKSENDKGHPSVKERITLLGCVNMKGEKKRLLVVGKDKNPRCFKNVKKLPVDYFSNESAHMTATIFNKWLLEWDSALANNVLLLVDDCTAHAVNVALKHINVVFLSADGTTSSIHQGIIHACKVHYRKLKARIIEQSDSTAGVRAKELSLLEAMHILNKAWGKVTAGTIRHGFFQGGFYCVDLVAGSGEQPTDLAHDYEAWMSVDDGVQVVEATAETGICGMLSPGAEDGLDNRMDEGITSAAKELDILPPTNAEMRNALHVLRRGVMQYAESFTELYRFEDFMNGLLRKRYEHATQTPINLKCQTPAPINLKCSTSTPINIK